MDPKNVVKMVAVISKFHLEPKMFVLRNSETHYEFYKVDMYVPQHFRHNIFHFTTSKQQQRAGFEKIESTTVDLC